MDFATDDQGYFLMPRTTSPGDPFGEPHTAMTVRRTPENGILRLTADILALIYIGVIAAVASATGAFYVMFPELAALSWNVMEQPRGRWASSPLLLAVTPPLTGLIGTVMTRTL